MRCKYCGSNVIHPDTQHKTFSGKKAVAGAVMFGVVGAAAGMIGKDTKGYTCGACGAFQETAMEYFTESSINDAIRKAESGGERSMFDYYKGQYPNIQANIPAPAVSAGAAPAAPPAYTVQASALPQSVAAQTPQLKHAYNPCAWQPECPVWVERVLVKASDGGDVLSLSVWNLSKQVIRSAYFKVTAFDDTGDKITEVSCVYQGLDVAPGAQFPTETQFKLHTEVAYRVEIVSEKMAMADGSVWRNTEDLRTIALQPQPQLTADNFPRFKYLCREVDRSGSTHKSKDGLFLPLKGEEHWQCVCGHPSLNGEPCRTCGMLSVMLDKCLDQKHLREVQQTAVKQIASKRATASLALREKAFAATYDKAAALLKSDTIATVKEAIPTFQKIAGYKDAEAKADAAAKRLAELQDIKAKQDEEARIAAEKKAEAERIAAEKAAEEKRIANEKLKKKLIIIGSAAAAVLVVLYIVFGVIMPSVNYNKAQKLIDERNFAEAISVLEELGNYKDAPALLAQVKKDQAAFFAYDRAIAAMGEGKYSRALGEFFSIITLKEQAASSSDPVEGSNIASADTYTVTNQKSVERAIANIEKLAGYSEFPDAAQKAQECFVLWAKKILDLSECELGEYADRHAQAYATLKAAGNYAAATEMLSHFSLKITDASKNAVNRYPWYNEDGTVAIDEDGYIHHYENGRLVKETLHKKNSLTDPGDVKAEIIYTYDENGRILSSSDGALTYTYTYDDKGVLLSYQTPLTTGTKPKNCIISFTYDDQGRVAQKVTVNEQTGRKYTLTHTYNDEGLLTKIEQKEQSLSGTFTYGKWSREYMYSYVYCPLEAK